MRADPAPLDTSEIRHPSAPDGFTIYVVGDVHRCPDLLVGVQRLIDQRAKYYSGRTAEIYLGDYIDRRPDSAGVVSRLIARASEGQRRFSARQSRPGCSSISSMGRTAWSNGGRSAAQQLLLSYGVAASLLHALRADRGRAGMPSHKFMPPEHRSFYDQTGSYMQVGPYLMVHAGIRPGIGPKDQKTADLLGIRQEFLAVRRRLRLHRGARTYARKRRLNCVANRINIDTGAFATNRLTCLRIGGGWPPHLLGSPNNTLGGHGCVWRHFL